MYKDCVQIFGYIKSYNHYIRAYKRVIAFIELPGTY